MDANLNLLILLLALSFVALVLVHRKEEQKRRFDLIDETLKQWHSNFNELRGMCDALAKNIDAMNERVNTVVKYEEDNMELAERIARLEEDVHQLYTDD